MEYIHALSLITS